MPRNLIPLSTNFYLEQISLLPVRSKVTQCNASEQIEHVACSFYHYEIRRIACHNSLSVRKSFTAKL